MNFKIIVNNPLEAAYLDFLIHMGTLNSSPEMVEKRFPELEGETKFNVNYILADKQDKIYGAREIESGKLVSDITNPRKKYWQQENACKQAISKHNSGRSFSQYGKLELVKFRLVEEE